jgi:hypothetical protein
MIKYILEYSWGRNGSIGILNYKGKKINIYRSIRQNDETKQYQNRNKDIFNCGNYFHRMT